MRYLLMSIAITFCLGTSAQAADVLDGVPPEPAESTDPCAEIVGAVEKSMCAHEHPPHMDLESFAPSIEPGANLAGTTLCINSIATPDGIIHIKGPGCGTIVDGVVITK